ncbi:MAG TPA: 50S ribosomal protein L28 [Phycisphaerae bacterium]|nr:50S ribosomal protein L28 [Phycisphaerae bacterium]HUX15426.1 50S ribosomal protein L28 [Phycisphaerae bacterium]
MAVPAKCEICGKTSSSGSSIKRRGKAKYLGGVGRKVTGISKRRFKPNLQRVRVELENGTRKRMRVCAQCISAGRVKKRSKRVAPAPESA